MPSTPSKRIDSFGFPPGKRLAGKYVVNRLLGSGWEGEVYHVTEVGTGVERAAKLFFPQRNPNNRKLTWYARKLDKLRDCPIVIQYHAQEKFRFQGEPLTFLVSEYVQGELLTAYLARQKGKRLHPFEALHLLHELVVGLEQIHKRNEYHGDLHSDNIMMRRIGLGFQVKVVDFYHWGKKTPAHILDDVCDAIRVFYDAMGGAKHYAKHPPEIKSICCGLKRTLIKKKFRTATKLREYMENLEWR